MNLRKKNKKNARINNETGTQNLASQMPHHVDRTIRQGMG
jgi:hypothetical protein